MDFKKIVKLIEKLPEKELKNTNKFLTRLLKGETFTKEEVLKIALEGCASVPVKKAAVVRACQSNDRV